MLAPLDASATAFGVLFEPQRAQRMQRGGEVNSIFCSSAISATSAVKTHGTLHVSTNGLMGHVEGRSTGA
jgi:hypothetical protein